jgi:MarR family transcriptional regulator, organic hydroperoxide resistance regulator
MQSPSELPDSSSLPESIRLLQLVWKLKAGLDRTSHEMETKLGVSGLQRFLLRFVGLVPGITRDGLAEVVSVEAAVVQTDLDHLVLATLLVQPSSSAGYYLTAKGVSVNATMTGTVEDAVLRASDEVSAYERTSFRRLLERVIAHLVPPGDG